MFRNLLVALTVAAVPVRLEAVAEARELYPHRNGGCYWVTERAECCQHTDGRNNSEAGHYYHERCVPAAEGKHFTSGRVCEPECWVKGLCGDGSPQGDRIGQCLDISTTTSAWLLDEHILVVSEDTSTITMTTTTHRPWLPAHVSNKDKIIAGAVAGSVGGVALLGGLLGGLLHTTVTTPSPTTTGLLLSTAAPAALNVTFDVSHTRFLQGHGPAANSPLHDTVANYLGSPWVIALAFGALSAAAVGIAVGFQSTSRSQRSRDSPGLAELADLSDESSDDEKMRSEGGFAGQWTKGSITDDLRTFIWSDGETTKISTDGDTITMHLHGQVYYGQLTGDHIFWSNDSTWERQDDQDRKARDGPDAFDLVDKNHDGVISPEEFNAAFVSAPYGALRAPQQ